PGASKKNIVRLVVADGESNARPLQFLGESRGVVDFK
ncbi:hypothetical protein L915_00168, partial [Phytophthora nicotianae]